MGTIPIQSDTAYGSHVDHSNPVQSGPIVLHMGAPPIKSIEAMGATMIQCVEAMESTPMQSNL